MENPMNKKFVQTYVLIEAQSRFVWDCGTCWHGFVCFKHFAFYCLSHVG